MDFEFSSRRVPFPPCVAATQVASKERPESKYKCRSRNLEPERLIWLAAKANPIHSNVMLKTNNFLAFFLQKSEVPPAADHLGLSGFGWFERIIQPLPNEARFSI
jgi:hypothetical protein